MDTQDTSPSVLLFFDKERFIFNAGEYESQLGSHPIASGELGYEIQIREAVVRPNCLTILRFKESRPPSKRRKVMKKLQNKAQRIKQRAAQNYSNFAILIAPSHY